MSQRLRHDPGGGQEAVPTGETYPLPVKVVQGGTGGGGGGDASEATLLQVRDNVQDLENLFAAEDFATETTLEAARVLLAAIDAALDVALSTRASEATVAGLLSEATFTAEDFASETTLASRASEATLAARASEATIAKRYGGSKTPVVATVTASGNTIIHAPTAGKAIRLYWISAITDPDEASNPLIKVGFGAAGSITTELYRVYATAHWEVFEGAADESLIVNLSGGASVAVTAHLEEFTP